MAFGATLDSCNGRECHLSRATPISVHRNQTLLAVSGQVQHPRVQILSHAADDVMRRDLFTQWLVVGFVGSRFENRFDGLVEEAGDTEGKREARVVLAGFNCVHGLS